VNGKLVVNPTCQQMSQSDMELNVSCTDERVVMIEAEGAEIEEGEMLEAIKMAHDICRELNDLQRELREKCGKEKIEVETFQLNDEFYSKVKDFIAPELEKAVQIVDKAERNTVLSELKRQVLEQFVDEKAEDASDQKKQVSASFDKVRKTIMRSLVMDQGKRTDGRAFDQVRDLWAQTAYLPRVHGNAIFTRGQTQCLSVVTLGSASDRQKIEGLSETREEHFLFHYNFPHFSVGETGFNRAPGRREIGHGELAERSLRYLLPKEEDFPYTIRVVADILESAGSTSMAAVCSASLALFDAGVTMRAPVAGISIGLMTRDGDINDYRILTDIYDEEDFTGDMDFKVAGTDKGITGIQCDMKVLGISHQIIEETLEAARKARLKILEVMNAEISKPREKLSEFAPQMETVKINPMKIGAVIGSGGAVIREIEADTQCKLDIQDDGTITVAGPGGDALQKAIAIIKKLTAEIEEGGIYDARVTGVKNFGLFVECLPKQEGLVHIGELGWDFNGDIEASYKRGDKVRVKCIGIDDQKRVKLSIRALQEKPADYKEPEIVQRREARGSRPPRRSSRSSSRS
jgi:polyribonucleotide nucleotidyltransferase